MTEDTPTKSSVLKEDYERLLATKQSVMEHVRDAGDHAALRNTARQFFDYLDVAGLLLQNLEWWIVNLPEMEDEAARKKFQGGSD